MKTVLLRAPVLTQSGYGVHSRQVARWLLSCKNVDLKVEVLPWGDTPWILDRKAYDGLVGELMKRVTTPDKHPKFDVSVQLQLPNEWNPNLGVYNVGITAGVETDRCNPAWIEACNRMTKVIVPSSHVAACLTNTGQVNAPLQVVAESYADAIASDAKDAELPQFSTPFNFLVFGQLTGDNPFTDRKNTFFTLKWLIEEFHGDPSVGIVLKTNFGRNTLIDKNKVMSVVRGIIGEVRKDKEFPKVHVLHGDMSDHEVASVYRHPQIKALVAGTRGEGFGLPILEAAASGLPIIATGWSGHTDYLSHGKYIKLEYNIEDVHKARVDGNIFVPGSRWACPTEQDFRKKVRKFYKSADVPQRWAAELMPKIRELYSHEAISRAYSEVLKDALC